MRSVNGRRTYDSDRRKERARRARQQVLIVARREFLANGYGATTMQTVASGAEVSVEMIYKAFGNKAGLVKAIHDEALAGPGPIPTTQISARMKREESDPRKLLHSWGDFVAEVTPRVSPVVLLIRAAAETDPAAATLWTQINDERLAGMTHDAQRLAEQGHLRPGITVQEAGDILWTLTSPELYDLLVMRRGWTAARFGQWVGESYIAALLDPA